MGKRIIIRFLFREETGSGFATVSVVRKRWAQKVHGISGVKHGRACRDGGLKRLCTMEQVLWHSSLSSCLDISAFQNTSSSPICLHLTPLADNVPGNRAGDSSINASAYSDVGGQHDY